MMQADAEYNLVVLAGKVFRFMFSLMFSLVVQDGSGIAYINSIALWFAERRFRYEPKQGAEQIDLGKGMKIDLFYFWFG